MGGTDTGLDLESFLLLLRADLSTLSLYALGILVLGLMLWLSWGSRRALRRCLAISVAAHVVLAVYGSTVPSFFRAIGPSLRDDPRQTHIREIRVLPVALPPKTSAPGGASLAPPASRPEKPTPGASPDIAAESLRLADARQTAGIDDRRQAPGPSPAMSSTSQSLPPLAFRQTTPSVSLPPSAVKPEARSAGGGPGPDPGLPDVSAARVSEFVPEVAKLRPAGDASRSVVASSPLAALPATDLRRESIRPEQASPRLSPPRTAGPVEPILLERAMPSGGHREGSVPALVDLTGASGGRNLTEVPRFYRSRLDANRSVRAERSGASAASEQAVERALDWLARHQDGDGRWDGGTARYDDGAAVKGDDDFTVHCPPGEACFGECAYFEADTALTGLALLSYLGAGYTHKDGKHATTVGKGLEFLIAEQKPDGDLRGPSRAVGMYCHAMATLALCEAYALSLDDHLRDPAERAIAFLARARARDRQAWRYAPGEPVGDTSILGWVVMALKSAREVGLRIPDQRELERGTKLWLDRVSSGRDHGLARYQPADPVTPTMTAEAWVCRQFLGFGGLGPASSEASAYLLRHESDRGDTNFYYWYYGTLAMYQHGGQPWSRWNARIRDRVVALQRPSGHQAGSWDPDESIYGTRGGRLYCTALATLTLEVYYRYLRLYDEPSLAIEPGTGADGPRLLPPASR